MKQKRGLIIWLILLVFATVLAYVKYIEAQPKYVDDIKAYNAINNYFNQDSYSFSMAFKLKNNSTELAINADIYKTEYDDESVVTVCRDKTAVHMHNDEIYSENTIEYNAENFIYGLNDLTNKIENIYLNNKIHVQNDERVEGFDNVMYSARISDSELYEIISSAMNIEDAEVISEWLICVNVVNDNLVSLNIYQYDENNDTILFYIDITPLNLTYKVPDYIFDKIYK